ELTFIGSTPVHQLNFGDAKVRRTVPDFLYSKLKSPKSLHHHFVLPSEENVASTIWEHIQPAALFSKANKLPDGSDSENLAWILKQVKLAGALEEKLALPGGSMLEQAEWLVWALQKAGTLNPLRMPNFHLSDADAEALTIALMSLSEVGAPSKRFEAPLLPKIVFNPKDEFGKLERHYRCLSCHTIRESGELLASDLTFEGNRVNREWLYHYLNKPYSMRRMITIAMPIFHFPLEESRILADYISQVFVNSQLGADWKLHQQQSDPERGQALFDAKGCIACHQLHGTGGDVGPSLTIQVPEFPQGTWVGDKLKGEWIYAWLKDPQALLPETIEPNMDLTDQEALDLTAFLLSLKNPEYQEPKHQEPEHQENGEDGENQ
ncbi:MAG: cytochrome c family protein, partial [Acidimicrobiales bacterium]